MKARKYEGSKADKAKDRKLAKKHGMTMKDWERSPMDKAKDRAGQKRLDKAAKTKH